MTRLLRDVRIIPVVLVATVCLFALKTMGLIVDGGYAISNERPPETVIVRNDAAPPATEKPRGSWAQEMFGYPGDEPAQGDTAQMLAQSDQGAGNLDITGSVGATKDSAAPPPKSAPKGGAASPPPQPGMVSLEPGRVLSPAERAILERLKERRGELEARERDIDMRESLLKAAEKRVEERVEELKAIEARINDTLHKRDEAEAARFKSLVSMYENMKAKDAARIFDRLDLKVLLDVSSQINPRRMSEILAQMNPEAAERLTVELANRLSGTASKPVAAAAPAQLPKIEGKPAN